VTISDLDSFTVKRTLPLVYDSRKQLIDPSVNLLSGMLYALIVSTTPAQPCNTTTQLVSIDLHSGSFVNIWTGSESYGLSGRSIAFHPTLAGNIYIGFAQPLGSRICSYDTQIAKITLGEKPRFSDIYTAHSGRGSIDLYSDVEGQSLYSVLDADGVVRFHDANNLIAKQTYQVPRNVAPYSIHPEVMGSSGFLYLVSNTDNVIALQK